MKAQLKNALLLLAGFVACLGLAAAAYWPGLAGAFILDDGANIVLAHIADPDWDGLVYTITHNGSGWLGRSVSMLSFVLTGLQYGLDPWGYKFHNLMLHLLNAVLLFRLLQLLLPLLDRRLDESRVLLVAGCAAAIWLLHPLLVSTVLYAVQRMTQMAALFTLLALLAYVKARLCLDSRWRYYLFGWLLFPGCALLAVLSKENGALVPLYVLAIEVLVFRTSPAMLRGNGRMALLVVVYALLPLVLGTLVVILKFEAFTDYSGRTFTLEERLLTQLHVMFFYVRLILLPRIGAMSLFHDDYPLQSGFDVATAGLLLVLVAVLVLIWKARLRAPVLAFGLAWFLISHLLESTFIPLELVFEHRNYLAAAGLILPIVHAVFSLDTLKVLRWVLPVVTLAFAFMTTTRAREWGNHELFTMVAITEHPGSGRAQNNYVNLLASRREYQAAVVQLEKMIATTREPGVYLHMLLLKCGMDTRDDEGLATVSGLLGSTPASVYTLNGLQIFISNVVEDRCKLYSLAEMEQLVLTALGFSMNQESPQNHSSLLRMRGIIAFAGGYYAQGYGWFMTAHEMTQDPALLHELLGYQVDLHKLDDAADTLALVEQRNAERFGIDTWRVKQLRAKLQSARAE